MANIGKLIVEGNEFHDNAAVIREASHGRETEANSERLQDLRELREQLETTVNAVTALEQAVKAQNKPKIRALLGKLTSGTAKGVITAIASKALLSWMGIK